MRTGTDLDTHMQLILSKKMKVFWMATCLLAVISDLAAGTFSKLFVVL